MNINNKLTLEETITGDYIICVENENYTVAEIMDATTEAPEEAERANRMVECYNLFLGIENPTKYFETLIKKSTPSTVKELFTPNIDESIPYNGLKVGDIINIMAKDNIIWGTTEVVELNPNNPQLISAKSINGKNTFQVPASSCKLAPKYQPNEEDR